MRERRLVLLAMVASLVTVATAFLKLPTPTGYVHLGDGIIYAAALAFGPSFGAISGALGSTLADLIGGYFIWAPWTFVIKGVAGWIVGKAGHGKPKAAMLLSMGMAGVWTVAAYALGTAVLYSPAAVPAEILGNTVQVGSGLAIGTVLGPVLASISSDGK
ncbi:MAG TPA: ECF transporter S component [Firmicutes bacterium]|nr:ECF transporter S component [Candidatus Fermentithermobacillaceae bacterium]